ARSHETLSPRQMGPHLARSDFSRAPHLLRPAPEVRRLPGERSVPKRVSRRARRPQAETRAALVARAQIRWYPIAVNAPYRLAPDETNIVCLRTADFWSSFRANLRMKRRRFIAKTLVCCVIGGIVSHMLNWPGIFDTSRLTIFWLSTGLAILLLVL